MNTKVSTARLDAWTARGATVLVVDDDATQLKLTCIRLRQEGFQVETAQSASEALEALRGSTPAAILSDVLMADVDGFALCRKLREQPALAHVPVILLSAHYQTDDDRALAERVGASAFVVRTPSFADEIATLRRCLQERTAPSIESVDRELYEQHLRTNANQMTRLLGQARSAEDRYRSLFENASDAITVLTPEGIVLDANRRWGELLGVPPEAMIGRHSSEFVEPGHVATRADARPVRSADGSVVYMSFSVSAVEIDGSPLLFSIGRDVTREVTAADALAQAEAKYRSLVERLPDVIWTSRGDGALTMITPNVVNVLGCTAEEIAAEDIETRLTRVHPEDRQRVREAFARSLDGHTETFEYRRQHADGRWVWLKNRTIGRHQRDGETYVEGMLTDITEHKRLEESLRQAQKMEAVARLTGGIAHDFNNILAAILANCHFLMDGLGVHDPRRSDAQEIQAAAERAAALTRQLLAFSRKQRLEPTTVDLNVTVVGLERMLRRLIGEDIELVVERCAELGAVRVDVGQMEQVIMNLVVNARDAMPQGGRLTIETRNAELGSAQAAGGAVPAGRYVTLAVSDTGVGMDPETRRRLFEPFFTTKEVGKGTGLGLSTCYGILKQSEGHIDVTSEPGHGSTFTVYLPRVDAAPSCAQETVSCQVGDGDETILLVEDDPHVRAALQRLLTRRGYKVLSASNGAEALDLAKRHAGAVHLVLSDVVMPGASGPELIERLRRSIGEVPTLLMSGYVDHALLRRTDCQLGANILQKPFLSEALAIRVRQCLDERLAQMRSNAGTRAEA